MDAEQKLKTIRDFALDASKKASEPDYRAAMRHIVQVVDALPADEPYDASRFCGPPSFCGCAKAMKARGDDITRPRAAQT